eukprot:CAMPEP_0177675096 /NCGR_PEP_ID=MMETSP0447-20121125/26981_1 /TAXON_ID=0 /ORGANISM="Stygamoeba regulata, Strain BSH-02190019" /LENGTH=36 /DNA_ID= /DNA_START= /DNA_END= /DNA_ORIENTATION=
MFPQRWLCTGEKKAALKKARIYTRTGDSGETSLYTG